ncbi:ABC transporter permease [bacterium]|nr:ABC transporter permease [bacterium]
MDKKFQTLLHYFTQEALHALLLSKGRSCVSIATIGFALFIFGIYLLIAGNVQTFVEVWQEEIHLEVFLSDDLTLNETNEIAHTIEALPDVLSPVRYISQNEALERFKKQGYENFFEGLSHNPLPASFQIILQPEKRTIADIKRISSELLAIPGIDDVTSGIDLVKKLEVVSSFIRMAGFFAGFLIFIASIFIISNTIKLSLYTRLDEIEIMKLVGATNSFVMVPYLIEGIIQGITGAFSSMFFIFIGYRLFLARMQFAEVVLLGFGPLSFLSFGQCLELVIIGIIIGLVGSFISVKHFLNPRFSRRLKSGY